MLCACLPDPTARSLCPNLRRLTLAAREIPSHAVDAVAELLPLLRDRLLELTDINGLMHEIRQLSAGAARRSRASTGSAAVGPATPNAMVAGELQPPAPAGAAPPASRAPALWDEVTLRCLTRLVTAVHAIAALHAVLRVQTTLCVRLEVAGRPQPPAHAGAVQQQRRRRGGARDRPSPADAYAESTPLHGQAALSLADGGTEDGGELSDAAGCDLSAAPPTERPYADVLAEHDAAARAAHRASIRVLCGVLLGTGLDALAASARTAVSAALMQPGRAAAWSVQQQPGGSAPSPPPLVSLADVEALLRDAAGTGMLNCAPPPAVAAAGGPSDGGLGGLLAVVTGWLGSALESGVAAAAAGLRDLLPPAGAGDAGGAAPSAGSPEAAAAAAATAAAALAAQTQHRLFGPSRLIDLVLPRSEALAASLLPAAAAATLTPGSSDSSASPSAPDGALGGPAASTSVIAWGPHLLTCLTLDVAASPAFAEALRAGVGAALSLSVASAAAAFAGPAAAAQGGRLAPPHAAQGLRSVTDALLQAQGGSEGGRPAVLGELADVASLAALCDALMWRARL